MTHKDTIHNLKINTVLQLCVKLECSGIARVQSLFLPEENLKHISILQSKSTIDLQSFHFCARQGNALVHGSLSCEGSAESRAHMQDLSLTVDSL